MPTLRTTISDLTITDFLAGNIDASELPEPEWGPIGKEVYERTYSRDIVDPKTGEARREVWAETARRVVLGNLAFAPESTYQDGEAVRLFRLLFFFKIIPAGRHLWVTGTASPYTRNCWYTGYEEKTSEHFRFLASRLFEGGGVGGNYSADLRAVASPIVGQVHVKIACDSDHKDFEAVHTAADSLWGEWAGSDTLPGFEDHDVFVVEDSREGWVDAWVALINQATKPGMHRIVFDLSNVRPHGAALKTFGGQASGPAPLAEAIVSIAGILNRASVAVNPDTIVGRQLTGLETMSIDHAIAASVVAGGTRRSARMSLMHWNDPEIFEFINCKADSSQHWSTNISVEIDEAFHNALASGSNHAAAVLQAVSVGMAANGEPGLFDASAHSVGEPVPIRGCNPCGEVSLQPWESCNIGSVNLEAFGTDVDGVLEAFGLVARFLYRATLRSYPDPKAAEIERKNRRIGVGIMGLQGWAAAHGAKLSDLHVHDRLLDQLSSFRVASRFSADALADELGLPHSVKVTSIAPTGSIAQMPGVTPGLHPVFARYFTRRVRYSDTDRALLELEASGHHIEDDKMAGNTKVVSFPVKDAILDRYEEGLIEQSDEFSLGEFMQLVQAVQDSFLAGSDGNAISATGQLPAGMDPEALVEAMKPMLGSLKGITAFPQVSRPQAPYTPLSKAEFEQSRDELIERANGAALLMVGDSNDGSCDTGACPIR